MVEMSTCSFIHEVCMVWNSVWPHMSREESCKYTVLDVCANILNVNVMFGFLCVIVPYVRSSIQFQNRKGYKMSSPTFGFGISNEIL